LSKLSNEAVMINNSPMSDDSRILEHNDIITLVERSFRYEFTPEMLARSQLANHSASMTACSTGSISLASETPKKPSTLSGSVFSVSELPSSPSTPKTPVPAMRTTLSNGQSPQVQTSSSSLAHSSPIGSAIVDSEITTSPKLSPKVRKIDCDSLSVTPFNLVGASSLGMSVISSTDDAEHADKENNLALHQVSESKTFDENTPVEQHESAETTLIEQTEAATDNVSIDQVENVTVEQVENVAIEQVESISFEKTTEYVTVEQVENTAVEQTENVSIEQTENVPIEQADNLSIEKTENVSIEQTENILVEQSESTLIEQAENFPIESVENVTVEQVENIAIEQAEKIAIEHAETITLEQTEATAIEPIENVSIEQTKDDTIELEDTNAAVDSDSTDKSESGIDGVVLESEFIQPVPFVASESADATVETLFEENEPVKPIEQVSSNGVMESDVYVVKSSESFVQAYEDSEVHDVAMEVESAVATIEEVQASAMEEFVDQSDCTLSTEEVPTECAPEESVPETEIIPVEVENTVCETETIPVECEANVVCETDVVNTTVEPESLIESSDNLPVEAVNVCESDNLPVEAESVCKSELVVEQVEAESVCESENLPVEAVNVCESENLPVEAEIVPQTESLCDPENTQVEQQVVNEKSEIAPMTESEQVQSSDLAPLNTDSADNLQENDDVNDGCEVASVEIESVETLSNPSASPKRKSTETDSSVESGTPGPSRKSTRVHLTPAALESVKKQQQQPAQTGSDGPKRSLRSSTRSRVMTGVDHSISSSPSKKRSARRQSAGETENDEPSLTLSQSDSGKKQKSTSNDSNTPVRRSTRTRITK
jgi:hypothetical protein